MAVAALRIHPRSGATASVQSRALFTIAAANARKPAFVAAIESCTRFGADAASLSDFMALHPRDQMLTHSLAEHRHADTALSQYFSIGIQQYRVLSRIVEQGFNDAARDIDILDFACGFGRLLRFLRCGHPDARLYAAEVQRDALDFCATQFGVTTIASTFEPSQFQPGRKFDVIWVASLFSHLPGPLFEQWLHVLLSVLSERGILCFSARALPADAPAADELVYRAQSENAELDTKYYGTTWVSERLVRELVTRRFGAAMHVQYAPRALANEQDLYLVSRRTSDLAIEKGPWGWLDVRRRDADGSLELQGWSADLDAMRPAHVEIRIDAQTFDVTPTIERPDVAAAFGNPALDATGWRLCRRIERNHVEIVSVAASGARNIVYVGEAFAPT